MWWGMIYERGGEGKMDRAGRKGNEERLRGGLIMVGWMLMER